MLKKYLSIQDAAEISQKSIQTIRRAIKVKKMKYRKQKTPQGFNYLVNYESLCKLYKIKPAVNEDIKIRIPKKSKKKKDIYVSVDDFQKFTMTLEKMVSQHSEERQNFIRLVDTLQEKIFVLENQLNLLKEPSKSWYQFWK